MSTANDKVGERRIRRAILDQMHVDESGTPGAPAIVFLHGAGASGRMWRHHVTALTEFHCLAPDFPGFGRSNRLGAISQRRTANLIADLIERRVPARRTHVVGLSYGGGIAHMLLDRRPDLVDRAVIDGAGILPWRWTPLVILGVTLVSPFLHTPPAMALFSGMIGMDDEGRDDLRAASRRAFARAFVDGFTCEVPRSEMSTPSPTLLVAGEKEAVIRQSNAALASVMPYAVARFAPGLAHGWLARNPELHVRMVEAWLTAQDLPSELGVEAAAPEARARLLREVGLATAR